LLTLFILNVFSIEEPQKRESHSLLFSEPIFLRVSSPTFYHLLADKIWLISNRIDEMSRKDEVDIDEFFTVYHNLITLDSTFEIAVIYSSTYLASIEERGDLAVKLLQTAQLFQPTNFQYLFTELVFQIAYLKSENIEYLKDLATRCGDIEDSYKYIGRIDVALWVDDIILYLQDSATQKEIQRESREWLNSIKNH
jgi:hypothetical protein